MSEAATLAAAETPSEWPEGLTRVPYWVFQRPAVYAAEQKRVFRGKCWSYLCLETDVRAAGDWRATAIGDAPIVVSRDARGAIHAFENCCAHRGALICLDNGGKAAKGFACVYHGWTYDLEGTLNGVAFSKGIKGKGGMPPSFKMSDHGPRKLRVETIEGLVFGTFDHDAPSLRDYLGPEITSRVERVFRGRKPVVLSRFTQALPNNWKLYIENVKDSYHASILHLFFTTFQINRLSQTGAIIVSEDGGHHISYSQIARGPTTNAEYTEQAIRSDSQYRLADPSLLHGFNEFPDGITLQILSVFPAFVLHQIQNSIATRQVIPRGPDAADLNWTILGFEEDTPEERMARLKQANLVGPAGFISMEDGCVGGFVQRGVAGSPDEQAVLEMGGHRAESSESRVTEASIRGFWKAYRANMGDLTMRDLYFAITRANADYARCIDDDRLEQWPDFFADDCLYRVTSAQNHAEGLPAALIFADSKGMLRDRVSGLREANIYERQAYRHILGAPSILGVEGERVRSEAPFMVARIMRDGTTSMFATGRYLDVWRAKGDAVELVERIVVCDSSRIDTLLALPL